MLLSLGCAHRGPAPVTVVPGATEKGLASWYGNPYHGRRTASGEIYNMHELTAAHRTLPFGTRVRVTRRDTGAAVTVRINDRGPFVKGRIIDLSYAAAKKIHLDIDGVAPVKLKVLGTSAEQEPAPTPPPLAPKASEGACWWVQVGSFSDPDNARRSRNRLREAGETAVMMGGPSGTQRVRVGPFGSKKDAKKARRRLRSEWPAAEIVSCGG
ncbi:MAG: septal ring lytic transglycosylase RlpA family protein [Acidobacteria bacterium]|nr:septal ring lytic transglycosylase RlpA family protein [Acidobacteriota bacterium]